MWFNHAIAFNIKLDNTLAIHQHLEEAHLKPCPAHARFIYGWLPVQNAQFVHQISGNTLICLGKEERILPRGVIQRLLCEQTEALEAQRGYPVKRAEKNQLAEELEFQLLPKAFCLQKKLPALIDHINQRLIINTSNANQAGQLMTLLRQALPGLVIEPIINLDNIPARLTHWMTQPETLPACFSISHHCVLTDLSDNKRQFNCKGYALPAEEISLLLAQGLSITEMTLNWHDKIEFTITDQLTFKRVRCLDYLVNEFNDTHDIDDDNAQQDAALALLAGEWQALLNDTLSAFSTPIS